MSETRKIATPLKIEHLPEIIRYARIRQNLTQGRLGDAVGVSHRRVQGIEASVEFCGKAPLREIQKLLEGIGVKIVLLSEEPVPEEDEETAQEQDQ